MSKPLKRCEIAQEIESVIRYKLEDLKIDTKYTQDIYTAFIKAVGGAYIYLPSPLVYRAYINSKNIYKQYNGSNEIELAKKHNVTLTFIKRLLHMNKEGCSLESAYAPKRAPMWTKFLTFIELDIQEALDKANIDVRHTQNIVEQICAVFGMEYIYIPLDFNYKSNQTAKRIYKEFKSGWAVKKLADKYNLSTPRIYQITQQGKMEQWDTHD